MRLARWLYGYRFFELREKKSAESCLLALHCSLSKAPDPWRHHLPDQAFELAYASLTKRGGWERCRIAFDKAPKRTTVVHGG